MSIPDSNALTPTHEASQPCFRRKEQLPPPALNCARIAEKNQVGGNPAILDKIFTTGSNWSDMSVQACNTSYQSFLGQMYDKGGYQDQIAKFQSRITECKKYSDKAQYYQNNSEKSKIPGDLKNFLKKNHLEVPKDSMSKEKWAEVANAIAGLDSEISSESQITSLQANNCLRQANAVFQMWTQIMSTVQSLNTNTSRNLT